VPVVIVVDVDRASLARVRLAPSAAQELMSWLRLTVAGGRHPVYGAPGPAARRSLGHRDVAMVASLLPRTSAGYVPDLLTPQPPRSTPARALIEQLDLVAAADHAQVARQVGFCVDFGRRLPADTLGAVASGSFARRAANGLRTFWKDALADGWGALREVLDADIATRSETLARRGVGDVLGSLHRDLEWDGRRITVDKPYAEERTIAGADLVLAPSALGWPGLTVQVCSPEDAVFCYPAEAIGQRRIRPAPELGELIGASRAAILGDLAVPRSTAELSDRHGLTRATVSHHLGVLFRAGMLVRRRRGKEVLYGRSDRGDHLLN
jgi:DNA-binding transcriptional ArsR family regulator